MYGLKFIGRFQVPNMSFAALMILVFILSPVEKHSCLIKVIVIDIAFSIRHLKLYLSLSLCLSHTQTHSHNLFKKLTLSKRFQTHNIASREHCSQKQAQPYNDLARIHTHAHTHTRSHAHTHINSHSLITLDEPLRITQLHCPSPINHGCDLTHPGQRFPQQGQKAS